MLCVLLLENVDWSRQIHVYGKATDTPQHLRALLGCDREAIRVALEHLDHVPLHQKTVSPAAVTCAQFLVAALDEAAIPLESTIDGVVAWLGTLGGLIDYQVSEDNALVDTELLEQFYQMNETEAGEFLGEFGCDLMDSLLARSLIDLHAYAPHVVATLKRLGATEDMCAGWEKYAS